MWIIDDAVATRRLRIQPPAVSISAVPWLTQGDNVLPDLEVKMSGFVGTLRIKNVDSHMGTSFLCLGQLKVNGPLKERYFFPGQADTTVACKLKSPEPST